MAKIIIESQFKHSASIYQIELICGKYGKVTLFSAFVDKNDAQNQINWYKENNYKEDVYKEFGKIYNYEIHEITLFA